MTENRKGASCGNTSSARNASQTTTKGRVIILPQPTGKGKSAGQDFNESLQALLPLGEASAVSMADLARWMGTDERTIRQAVFDLRQSGHVICGTAAGYFLPGDRGELRAYYLQARKRAISGLASLRAARKMLREMEEAESGQMRLDDAGRPTDNQRTTKTEQKITKASQCDNDVTKCDNKAEHSGKRGTKA